MARETGKWVARAGATGGSRTYRGQKPVNWYAALVLIAVIGLASVVYSRYEYQNPTSSSSSSAASPTTSDTWYAGFQADICGTATLLTAQSKVASNVSEYTAGQGVVTIHPTDKSQTGANATLALFVKNYPGLTISSTKLGIAKGKVYSNGEKCPKGTPFAGKKSDVQLLYYSNYKSDSSTPFTNPASLKYGQWSLVSVAFVPPGTKVNKNSTTELALLDDQSKSTTTTTAPTTATTAVTVPTSVTTTTAASSSTTTAPSSTATTVATTTTTPATTTSAPANTTTTSKTSKSTSKAP